MAAPLPTVELRYTDLRLSLQLPKSEPTEPKTVRDVLVAFPRRLLDRFRPESKRSVQTRELKVLDNGESCLIAGHFA